MRTATHLDRHTVGDVGLPDRCPLLELHDDRAVTSLGVGPRDQAVEATRSEGQLQFDKDALVGEVGQLEDVRHRTSEFCHDMTSDVDGR